MLFFFFYSSEEQNVTMYKRVSKSSSGGKLEFSVDIKVSWIFREMVFHVQLQKHTTINEPWEAKKCTQIDSYAHNRHK